MKLPKTAKKLEEWAHDLIDECSVSRQQRATDCAYWRNYYFNGADAEEQPAIYNRCFPHVDRAASYLFSPANLRFVIEFDSTVGEAYLERAAVASRFLSREFDNAGCGSVFSLGVELSLIKGCALLKQNWGNGIDPVLVHPESFGVLREDISSLDRQEAFVHTVFLTPSQLRRNLWDHPDQEEIIKKVERSASGKRKEQRDDNSFMHQMMIGAIHPIGTPGEAVSSMGSVSASPWPAPVMAPEIARTLIRLDELWVIDDERQDYTTLQMIGPDIIVEGKYKRRNLCGVKGEHPFTRICPNEIDGYFWGRSELASVRLLQNMINRRVDEYDTMCQLRAKSPRIYTGFSGITDTINEALHAPGGQYSSSDPTGTVKDLAPTIPPDLLEGINEIIRWFDDVGGFENVMKGQGESGVRAGVHADTLMRSAGNRIRDRALLVERACSEAGDFAFRLLQQKEAEIFSSKATPMDNAPTFGKWLKAFQSFLSAQGQQELPQEFVLSQFPEDFRVHIDAHSASPAFSEDARAMALELAKLGAIDAEGVIDLIQPPHADLLVDRARRKQEAEAAFLQQHPELAAGKKKKK